MARNATALQAENEALRQHINMLKDALLLSTLRGTGGQVPQLPRPGSM